VKVLFVDPGESTGWSVTEDSVILDAGTHELDEFVDAVGLALGVAPDWSDAAPDPELMDSLRGVGHVVMEDWKLYPDGNGGLVLPPWDSCLTARGIGALTYIARAAGVPYTLQPAKIKPTAVAGGAEELFTRPLYENRHQNDSLMHAVYWHVKRELPPVRHRQEGRA
jgi:hypothetical protein